MHTCLANTHWIVVTPNGLWVSGILTNRVVKIGPATNQPGRIIDENNGGSFGMVGLDGSIRVAHLDDVVVRIDPAP